jgi:DNA-binding transcriptional regulator WhiA
MSFADSVREELALFVPKKPCCRKALAMGLLFDLTFDEKKQIAVRYNNQVGAALAEELISSLYSKAPESCALGACGHRYWDLTFSAPSLYKLHRQLLGGEKGLDALINLSCESCRSAFLRGLFLGTGSVNDPHKSFHLEILVREEYAEILSAFLADCGYPPRSIRRPKGIGLYYKNSSSVEELLTLMGAQNVVFEVINSRIEREIRNNENRATNCVAKNIEKAISAATRQMDAINKLMEHGKLENLPEGVRDTAMIRYRNPDATLEELRFLHNPPISKSGLNHRLQKILQEADDI